MYIYRYPFFALSRAQRSSTLLTPFAAMIGVARGMSSHGPRPPRIKRAKYPELALSYGSPWWILDFGKGFIAHPATYSTWKMEDVERLTVFFVKCFF